MDTLIRLQKIFRDVFDDEAIVLTAETSPEDIEGWDSLEQINIILACEAEFGVKFGINEIARIKKAGHIVEIIEGGAK